MTTEIVVTEIAPHIFAELCEITVGPASSNRKKWVYCLYAGSCVIYTHPTLTYERYASLHTIGSENFDGALRQARRRWRAIKADGVRLFENAKWHVGVGEAKTSVDDV